MATILFTLIAFGGGYLAGAQGSNHVPSGGSSAAIAARCYFCPGGGCTDAVIAALDSAHRSVELHGCTLTSPGIGAALVAARKRGVRVQVVLDAAAASENRVEVEKLVRAGIPVRLDARHAVAHNKVMLIDERTLMTGSFDFSDSAEAGNADNLLILRDQPQLQSAYEENFRAHLAHSELFDGK